MGPVDFRSLGVREFGTIYEGLLESELSVAETDLTVETRGKSKDAYRPCREGEEPAVPEGKVYLHNSSGARKSTGSYFTKHFAVEHLLDRALEPALGVIVKGHREKVFVLGHVRSTGVIEYRGDITLIQAIAGAGGLKSGAKSDQALVIRRRRNGGGVVGVEVDVGAILDGAIGNDIPLCGYDIVYLPKSRLSSVADFSKALHEIISLPMDVGFTVWQIRSLQESIDFYKQSRNNR